MKHIGEITVRLHFCMYCTMEIHYQRVSFAILFCYLYFYVVLLQPHLNLSRYQTLPGKLSKMSELRSEMSGSKEREGDYLSPVHFSPVRGHDQDYNMSEFV